LQLPRDDVPISGRIIDLQGQPVAGATVAVLEVRTPAGRSLDGWLKALEHRKGTVAHPASSQFLPIGLWAQTDPPFIPPVKTDADGRFLIAGVGHERVATLEIGGPTIETVDVVVRTRPGATIRVPKDEYDPTNGEQLTVYGATFEHVAGPTRPIEGIVRDIDTQAPLAGIMVHGERSLGTPQRYVRAITDAQGHYRLVGLPRGREGNVQALAPVDFPLRGYGDCKDAPPGPREEDLPYLAAKIKVGASGGMGPIKLDIHLKRGVWVTGRVIDADAAKPVRAQLQYYVFEDNPHLEGYRESRELMFHYHDAGRDGAFRFVAFPGPGMLVASASREEYIQGAGVEALKHKPQGGRYIPAYPNGIVPEQYQAVAEIDPAPGTVSMTRDLMLQRGRSLTVTVLGPDGKPVSGNEVAMFGKGMGYWEKHPVPSTYTIRNWRPGEERLIRFLNREGRLAGELVLRGDGPEQRSMTLKPWGVLTGRLVDADGQPWGLVGALYLHPLGQYTKIGKDGRFRAEGLTPGKTYTIRLSRKGSPFGEFGPEPVTVGPGETKDLGDIVPRPPR
jgi:hypothetical protein